MSFELKNAPSEFQNIINDIFTPYTEFSLSYINELLVFSNSIDQHLKHLETYKHSVIRNGLVVSEPKMKLFQTKEENIRTRNPLYWKTTEVGETMRKDIKRFQLPMIWLFSSAQPKLLFFYLIR